MNLVSLRRLNELRFAGDPVPQPELARWCQLGRLPAVKLGRCWRVDLDRFDAQVDPDARPSDTFDARAAARFLFGSRAKG